MEYEINIDFKKGPSFSSKVRADNEDDAMKKILSYARNNGFKEKIKKGTLLLVDIGKTECLSE